MQLPVHKTDDELEVFMSFLEDKLNTEIDTISNEVFQLALENNLCHHNSSELAQHIARTIYTKVIMMYPEQMRMIFEGAMIAELIESGEISTDDIPNNVVVRHIH